METNKGHDIAFDPNTGLVHRKFTKEWAEDRVIRIEAIPKLVNAMSLQHQSMVLYIESLHNKMDEIIKKNNICPYCLIANCTSDHK